MNTIERDELLKALYQVTTKGDLLSQFDSKLSGAKGSTTQRYTHLLEQIVFYSHAIIFGHGVQTAHNYRQSFMTTAKKNKLLKLNNKDIEKAFSFLNRTEKWDFLSDAEKIEVLKERQAKKPNERTEKQLQKIKSSKEQKQQNKDGSAVNDSCIAKDEVRRLKAQLDNKTYELAKGQKKEDKEIFIKVALVALSTGARLKDIMEDLTVSTKKGVIYFDDGISSKEGVILELDAKTVRGYLKAIRSHYSDRIAKGTDISTGIRKAVKRLNIPNCGNTNNLNTLYRECLTSSTPK